MDLLYPVAGRMHVDHCLEALRLSFMCYSDITPLVLPYDDTRRVGRKLDFSVHHKCRNFDKIVDWVKENGVDVAPANALAEGREDPVIPPHAHTHE